MAAKRNSVSPTGSFLRLSASGVPRGAHADTLRLAKRKQAPIFIDNALGSWDSAEDGIGFGFTLSGRAHPWPQKKI